MKITTYIQRLFSSPTETTAPRPEVRPSPISATDARELLAEELDTLKKQIDDVSCIRTRRALQRDFRDNVGSVYESIAELDGLVRRAAYGKADAAISAENHEAAAGRCLSATRGLLEFAKRLEAQDSALRPGALQIAIKAVAAAAILFTVLALAVLAWPLVGGVASAVAGAGLLPTIAGVVGSAAAVALTGTGIAKLASGAIRNVNERRWLDGLSQRLAEQVSGALQIFEHGENRAFHEKFHPLFRNMMASDNDAFVCAWLGAVAGAPPTVAETMLRSACDYARSTDRHVDLVTQAVSLSRLQEPEKLALLQYMHYGLDARPQQSQQADIGLDREIPLFPASRFSSRTKVRSATIKQAHRLPGGIAAPEASSGRQEPVDGQSDERHPIEVLERKLWAKKTGLQTHPPSTDESEAVKTGTVA